LVLREVAELNHESHEYTNASKKCEIRDRRDSKAISTKIAEEPLLEIGPKGLTATGRIIIKTWALFRPPITILYTRLKQLSTTF
jgi:hypothetical protein